MSNWKQFSTEPPKNNSIVLIRFLSGHIEDARITIDDDGVRYSLYDGENLDEDPVEWTEIPR